MKTSRVLTLLLAITGGLFEVRCTTKQARNVSPPEKGDATILGDYGPLLQKGKGDEALLTYKNPNANWRGYDKVIVMPVKFEKPDKASESDLADLQKLADNAFLLMNQELGQDIAIVAKPGPDTLRVEMALYNAKKKHTVMNFVSGVMPIGMALNLFAVGARGKPLGVGELSGEMKVTDAASGEILAAAVDRRVGRKYQSAQFKSWGEAEDAIVYWSKRSRFVLCELRAMPPCVQP